jgi:hypothetical protein
MTAPRDFGLPPPEVLASIVAAARAARPTIEAVQPITESVQPIITRMRPVLEMIARQHSAIEEMSRSFDFTLKIQLPPRERAKLAALVQQLGTIRVAPIVALRPPQQAEQAVVGLMPQTPEELDEVRQGVAEIEQNPEYNRTIRHLIYGIDWGDVGELTAWGALILAANWLYQVADWPVTKHLSSAQTAALPNQFMVLAIIVALAAIIFTTRRRS